MKKNLVSILALAALVSLAGCGEKTSNDTAKGSDTPTTDKVSNSATDSIVVNSVSITNSEGSALTEDDLTVLDGTSVTLKANVSASKTGLKVSWSSSNSEVAKVTNGVVRFLSVSATTDVTITATSKDDTTKSASVTFHVQHSMIDFSSSRGTDLDTSEFLSDGKISVGVGDTALVFADVYDTKWYVQADITYTAFSESDNYPKFGIMNGNKAGIWNATTESDICYNNFFYLDTTNPNSSSSWSNFNTVTTDSAYTNWSWGTQLGGFNYNYKMGETLTLGLLRDGQDYYEFVTKQNEDGTDGELVCMKHVVDTLIPADEKTYAWVGGWATAAEVSNFKSLTGDAVDAMYKNPSDLTVNGDGTTLYLGETYQLNVSADFINFNSKKLTYTSSDDTVAEVSSTGLITAKNKAGSADITISYGDSITKTIKINVTDDLNFKVDIDGKMEDSLWSDTVKANSYRLNLNGTGEYIDFYGAMNSRGIYLFAKAHVNNMKSGETSSNWWENDNFEMKFMDTTTGIIKSANPDNDGQVWISANKTSNFEGYFVSDTVLNEETNKYDIIYETFTSFDRLNQDVDAGTYNVNTPIAVCFGSNPASGWKQADAWQDATNSIRVTKDGFMHADGKYCSDGDHEYGDWVVTKANTCGEDGLKTKTCKYCAHEETEVIAKDESAHVFDIENATVKTASTCKTKGTGTAECTVCHTKKDVELPLDPSNHEETYDSDKGVYACCGETIKLGETKSLDADAWKLGVSRLVMDGNSDFEVEYDIHNDENSSKDGAASNWVGDLSSGSKKEDGTYGEWANGGMGMTITADWNAWGLNANVHEANDTSNMPGDWFGQGYMLWFGNMDMHLNVKFVNGAFEINGEYTFLGDGAGHSMKVHYTSTTFTTKDYMVLNFGCQKSNITYKSVKVVSGTLIAHTTK